MHRFNDLKMLAIVNCSSFKNPKTWIWQKNIVHWTIISISFIWLGMELRASDQNGKWLWFLIRLVSLKWNNNADTTDDTEFNTRQQCNVRPVIQTFVSQSPCALLFNRPTQLYWMNKYTVIYKWPDDVEQIEADTWHATVVLSLGWDDLRPNSRQRYQDGFLKWQYSYIKLNI